MSICLASRWFRDSVWQACAIMPQRDRIERPEGNKKMPITANGRLGKFSERELKEAEELGHVRFLATVGVAAPHRGKFRSIDDGVVRRCVAKSMASMSDRDFDDAWQKGHIGFLADAWGCTPKYLRGLRTKPYPPGPGWRRKRTAEVGGRTSRRDDRMIRLEALNRSLKPPRELGGVFLPKGCQEQFQFMFVAEMPAMNEPKDRPIDENFNFDVTVRDKFLQGMMIKYRVGGSYATDIVKERDVPRRPTRTEINKWLPFLLKEIGVIGPKAIVVLGRRTYVQSFKPVVERRVPRGIVVDWVFHYGSQVRRDKFERRFSRVIARIRRSLDEV